MRSTRTRSRRSAHARSSPAPAPSILLPPPRSFFHLYEPHPFSFLPPCAALPLPPPSPVLSLRPTPPHPTPSRPKAEEDAFFKKLGDGHAKAKKGVPSPPRKGFHLRGQDMALGLNNVRDTQYVEDYAQRHMYHLRSVLYSAAACSELVSAWGAGGGAFGGV